MVDLILSNVLNYQRELISLFERFLQAAGASAKTQKNYVSDLRHFFTWFTTVIETKGQSITSTNEFVLAIDIITVLMYKQALWETQTPVATINRRLSTLRSFFDCTTQANITQTNPLSSLENIEKNTDLKLQNQNIIKQYLSQSHVDIDRLSTLKTTAHIEEFLIWIRKRIR